MPKLIGKDKAHTKQKMKKYEQQQEKSVIEINNFLISNSIKPISKETQYCVTLYQIPPSIFSAESSSKSSVTSPKIFYSSLSLLYLSHFSMKPALSLSTSPYLQVYAKKIKTLQKQRNMKALNNIHSQSYKHGQTVRKNKNILS